MNVIFKKRLFACVLGAVTLLTAQNFVKDNQFSHTYHVTDEEISCTTCHEGIDAANSLQTLPEVKASVCVDCHEDDIAEDQKLAVTFKDKSFLLQKRTEPGKLLFSHKGHVGRDTVNADNKKCETCHGGAAVEGAEPVAMFSMASCVTCHEENSAPVDCKSCHPSALKPLTHKTGAWHKGEFHGRDALFNKQDCSSCHKEEDSCTECHMGMNGKKVHRPNYEYTHGVDVRFKTKDCSTCHQPVEQFCGDCHLPK